MLLDNVHTAQTPKEASFFHLEQESLTKKIAVNPCSPFSQPLNLQKKKKKKIQQNQNQVMARYVCLWNCLWLGVCYSSCSGTHMTLFYHYSLQVPTQLTSQFPWMKLHAPSGEKNRMRRGKKMFREGIYSQGQCSRWSKAHDRKVDLLLLSQPPEYLVVFDSCHTRLRWGTVVMSL